MQKTKEIAEAVFTPLASFTHTEAISQIMKHSKKGESTSKTNLSNMVGWDFVEKGPDGRYRIVKNI